MGKPTLTPFGLLTPRLLILPTPFAVKIPAYRALYSRLHSLPEFCTMAFGESYLPRMKLRDDAETESWIGEEVQKNWNGPPLLGDFAVGIFNGEADLGRLISDIEGSDMELRLIGDEDYEEVERRFVEVEWVGYAGVRDATPRLPPREDGDAELPPWEEMVELRYGFAPEAWGRGYGTEAAKGLMLWAEKEMGVRRFIAETEKLNLGSARILGKLGFQQKEGNEYWKDPLEIEWEKNVGKREIA